MAPNLREGLIQRQRQERTQHVPSSWQVQLSRGLPILRNWCYANSIFQALLHAPKFVNWLEQEHQSCIVQDCLACALRGLSLNYWKYPFDLPSIEESHSVLRHSLRQSPTFDKWNWRIQQDAAEFYLKLIGALQWDKGPEIGLVTKELFEFGIIRVMECPECGIEEYTVQSNTLLIVSFEGGAPLEDILRDETFGPSIYSGRRCEVCLTCTDTTNVPQLVTGPDILVMQFVRFNAWDGFESEKHTAVISFNEELDLSPFTRGNFPLKYRLLSVVQHRGARTRGHYITIAKGPSGEWTELNDGSASPATEPNPFCPRDEDAFTPYVLFWARLDKSMAAESPMDDEPGSTDDDDDDDDDDELRPLQISIDGIVQPLSGNHFVKKSVMARLKQKHMLLVEANTNKALLELETRKREEEKEKENNGLKKPRKTSNKTIEDAEKEDENPKKAKGKNGKRKMEEEEEEEREEESGQKESLSKKHEKSAGNNESQEETKGISKKQKSLVGNSLSQDQKKKGVSKKRKTSDDEPPKEGRQKKPRVGERRSARVRERRSGK